MTDNTNRCTALSSCCCLSGSSESETGSSQTTVELCFKTSLSGLMFHWHYHSKFLLKISENLFFEKALCSESPLLIWSGARVCLPKLLSLGFVALWPVQTECWVYSPARSQHCKQLFSLSQFLFFPDLLFPSFTSSPLLSSSGWTPGSWCWRQRTALPRALPRVAFAFQTDHTTLRSKQLWLYGASYQCCLMHQNLIRFKIFFKWNECSGTRS